MQSFALYAVIIPHLLRLEMILLSDDLLGSLKLSTLGTSFLEFLKIN